MQTKTVHSSIDGGSAPSSGDLVTISRQELERLERLATVGTLAAGIAHELNNLLTPVLGYAQLAESHPEDATLVSKALERASRGVESATTIATALLDFTGARTRLEFASVDECLDGALACMGRPLEKDGIELRRAIPAGACARMNGTALQQVLLNLILNARRVLKDRGWIAVRVQCLASAGDPSEGRLVIEVEDSGPGLPESVRQGLSEGALPASAVKGHGFGLAICRRLVEQCGGTMTVGEGSGGATFRIELAGGAAKEGGQNDPRTDADQQLASRATQAARGRP